MADKIESRSVFVTVGTTSFDDLIRTVTSPDVCSAINSRGYTKLIIQLGRGDYTPDVKHVSGVDITWYRYKDTLRDDVKMASLVISHAGAGSIMESLREGRHLVVVINEKLMHNHQFELADKMAAERYLVATTSRELRAVICDTDFEAMRVYTEGDPRIFGRFIDSVMS